MTEAEALALARAAVLERDGYVCAYCGGRAVLADHLLVKADRRRTGIAKTDTSWMVASCSDDNTRKYTLRRVPPSREHLIPRLLELTGYEYAVWRSGESLGPPVRRA